MKRVLPSLTALAAFEAAARRASFTRAGEELGLTQSAVSRQVAYLERFLGVRLFERVRRRVILTEAGVTYAAKIRASLNRAESATLEVLASKDGGRVLHICSLNTFATHWLMPRMRSFVDQYPEFALQISSYHHRTFDDVAADVDVAIHYGEASWPDGLVERLMDEVLVPMCSPAYAEAIGLKSVEDLGKATLLQQTTRPDAWTDLLSGVNRDDINSLRGPRFELYSMIIEAALTGMGVGAIPRFLAEEHLASGRLVIPFEISVPGRSTYYLAYPEAKRQLPEVQAFRKWIQREVRRSIQKN